MIPNVQAEQTASRGSGAFVFGGPCGNAGVEGANANWEFISNVVSPAKTAASSSQQEGCRFTEPGKPKVKAGQSSQVLSLHRYAVLNSALASQGKLLATLEL